MKRRKGLSFIEILFSCILLLILLIPLGMLLTQAHRETRTSLDEFYGALYLSELVDQIASMPWRDIPLTTEAVVLTSDDIIELSSTNKETRLHLARLRANFTNRTVEIKSVLEPANCIKEIRAKVEYKRANGSKKSLEMITYVSRGARPGGGS